MRLIVATKSGAEGFVNKTVVFLVCVAVTLPTVLFGSVRPPLQGLSLFAGALAFLWALVFRILPRQRPPILLIGFLIPAAFASIQAIPLGQEPVLTLQGPAARLLLAGFELSRTDQPWWSLSLAPADTLAQASRCIVYAGIFLATWAVTIRGYGRAIILSVALLGAFEFLAGIFHGLTAPQGLSLFYDSPTARRPGFLTTLLNGNHAATLFMLSASAWLVLALEWRGTRLKALAGIGMVVCVIGIFLTFSRGATLVLTTVTILIGGGYLVQRHFTGLWKKPVAWFLLTVIAVLNIYVWLGLLEHIFQEYGRTSFDPSSFSGKITVWQAATRLIADHPFFGVGAGAFGHVIGQYSELRGYSIERAESEFLQVLADFGVPIGLFLVAFFAFFVLRKIIRLRRSQQGLALGAGIIAVGLHSLGEFSLEVPGVTVPLVGMLGFLFGRHHRVQKSESVLYLGKPWRVLLAFTVIGFTGLGFWATNNSNIASRERLTAVVQELRDSSRSDLLGPALSREARYHPLDHHLYFLAAQGEAILGNPERALALVEHALVLQPQAYGPSRFKARLLAGLRRGQEAAATLVSLLDVYPRKTRDLFRDLRRLDLSAQEVLAAFKGSLTNFTKFIDFLRHSGDLQAYEDLLFAALRERPDAPELLERVVLYDFARNRLSDAYDAAWRFIAFHPENPKGYDLAARAAYYQGRSLEALVLFQEAAKREKDPTEAQLWILACLARLRDFKSFDELVRVVEPKASRNNALRGRFARTIADAEYRRGRAKEAIRILERAWSRDPNDIEIMKALANILILERRHREAAVWLRRALKLRPDDQRLIEKLEETEQLRLDEKGPSNEGL